MIFQCTSSKIEIPAPSVPIHLEDVFSIKSGLTKFMGNPELDELYVYHVAVPSNLVNPLVVANHIKPYLSLIMAFTVLDDNPSLTVIEVNLTSAWPNALNDIISATNQTDNLPHTDLLIIVDLLLTYYRKR